jgi:hypothetical protein
LTIQSIGIGGIIAILVILLAVLGMLSVLPSTHVVVFGLIGLLAVARLT